VIETVKAWGKSLDNDDARFFISMLVGLLLWWVFIGRKRYSTKGMR
jgi:hypothetical protein